MLAAAIAMPAAAGAVEYPWLTFKMADNTELSVASSNLTILYEDGSLKLKSANQERSIPVDELVSMRFTSESSAVAEIRDAKGGVMEFFTIDGVKAGEFASIEEASANLASGIYVAKTSTSSFKIIF